jgi:hypothetical protein
MSLFYDTVVLLSVKKKREIHLSYRVAFKKVIILIMG